MVTEHFTFSEPLVHKTQMIARVANLEISNKNQYAIRIGVLKSALKWKHLLQESQAGLLPEPVWSWCDCSFIV